MLLVPWLFKMFLSVALWQFWKKNARVDKEWSGWRSSREKHREDWDAAANERSGALSHTHRTSVRWRQSPGRSLYVTDVQEGLVLLLMAKILHVHTLTLQQVRHIEDVFYFNSSSIFFLKLNILVAASLLNWALWLQQVLAPHYFGIWFSECIFFLPLQAEVSVILEWKSIIGLTLVTLAQRTHIIVGITFILDDFTPRG